MFFYLVSAEIKLAQDHYTSDESRTSIATSHLNFEITENSCLNLGKITQLVSQID